MQVLLPLKEFAAAKQRLAGVLSAPERAQLFEAMVDDVLNVLTAQPAIERVVICSRDRAAVWLARYYEVEFLHEDQLEAAALDRSPAAGGALNAVVNAAARRCLAQGATDLLVVHGDLPLLNDADLSHFIERHQAGTGPAVTIAPDLRHSGTNLLAWRGLPEFTTCYGTNSLQQHCAQARALGVEPTLCELAGARCDIDEPEDLMLLLRTAAPRQAARTLAYLQSSGIAARIALMLQGEAGADFPFKDQDTDVRR
jgi:2-phospho-L-lactate guanylyltransferase